MRLTQTLPSRPARRPRRGVSIVEAAFVLPIFVLFLFGIFEYCRYLMTVQVVHNAARDAARWGVVRGSTPEADIYTVTSVRRPWEPAANPARPMYDVPFLQARFVTQTVGVERNISNMQVRVFTADAATLYTDPPVIQPKANTTTWNAGTFSERLAVQVVGDFVLLTPNLIFMNSTAVQITALAGLEG
jgi:Flp pilus assembly protein TadG